MNPHYTVTAAIITNQKQILCMQRSASKYDYVSYKYEFPGGKLEQGESHEACLIRELKEEMNLDVKITPGDYFMTVNHEYPDFSIEMHSYIIPVDNRNFEMLEHNKHCWLHLDKLMELDWAPADIPIVKALIIGKVL